MRTRVSKRQCMLPTITDGRSTQLASHRSPAIQFTLRSLMIGVAIAALLVYLGRLLGDRLFFGLLPVVAALMGVGYRKLKPTDHRSTPREGIMVGLLCLAILSPAVALRLDERTCRGTNS